MDTNEREILNKFCHEKILGDDEMYDTVYWFEDLQPRRAYFVAMYSHWQKIIPPAPEDVA